jgi:AraC-like DNA-binding protein
LSINYATATLASTAGHLHYHSNYLSNFIKKNTGKTFSAILNDIKLSQAIYYLVNTNMQIKDISERLGFNQLCNFYDFIKNNLGKTPLGYRCDNTRI